MAINTISYTNKSDINTTTTPVQNKVSASDMNEIKSVVNSNATLMGDLTSLNTSNKTSLVSAINSNIANIVTDGNEVQMPWKVDNKWVYAKRFTLPSLNDGTMVAHGLSNFEIIDVEAVTLFSGTYRVMNYPLGGGYYVINIDGTNITYNASVNLNGTGKITLYYIKTS